MLTYLTALGQWRCAVIGSFTGNAFIPSLTVGFLWVVPPVGSVVEMTQVPGYITNSAKDSFGERKCDHYEADGDLFSIGSDNFNVSTIRPFSDPNLVERTLSFYTLVSGKKAVTTISGPVLTGNSINYDRAIPDHSVGSYDYRNILYSAKSIGSDLVCTVAWEQKLKTATKWTVSSMTSTTQLDSTLARYRVKTTTWQAWKNCSPLYFASTTQNTSRGILDSHDLVRVAASLQSKFVQSDNQFYGDLAIRCAESARSIDMNSLEYLRDFARFFSDVKDIRALLGKKSSLKKFSEMYLTYKYGPGLTVSDTLDLLQLMQHFTLNSPKDYSWVRASEEQHTITAVGTMDNDFHLKVAYSRTSDELKNIIGSIQSIGLLPTPKSIWELIPLSFVADWFIPVSDILSAQDARITWGTHAVKNIVKSKKTVYGAFDPRLARISGYVGELSFRCYNRWMPPSLDLPVYFSDTPFSFHNYAELGALMIAMKR